MDRFKRILVPVDGSRASFKCLRIACQIAAANAGTIHLVHVISTTHFKQMADYTFNKDPRFNELMEKAERDGNSIFKTFINDLKKESTFPFTFVTKILKGESEDEEIIKYANESNVDLIIVSKASKRHAWNVLVGHVAMRIVEFSRVPVLTIPAEMGDEP
jgi:nucleotide-binding universal stress UspA family protein